MKIFLTVAVSIYLVECSLIGITDLVPKCTSQHFFVLIMVWSSVYADYFLHILCKLLFGVMVFLTQKHFAITIFDFFFHFYRRPRYGGGRCNPIFSPRI